MAIAKFFPSFSFNVCGGSSVSSVVAIRRDLGVESVVLAFSFAINVDHGRIRRVCSSRKEDEIVDGTLEALVAAR